MTKKSWFTGRNILFALFLLVALQYLLVCLVPFLDPEPFWFIGMLGLGFPLLVLLMLAALVVWSVKRSRWALITLGIMLLGWKQVSALVGFHFFSKEYTEHKEPGDLRVFFWNVARWDEHNRYNKGGESFRELMLDIVGQQDADVLCLQEFFEPYQSQYFKSNLEPLKEMGFRYHYFFPSSVMRDGELKIGLIILSRFPIVDSSSMSFGQTPHSEGFCYADIRVKNQIVRVLSTHLESSRMGNFTYFGGGDAGGRLDQATGMVRTLKHAYAYRAGQARIVADHVKASPYPVIVCGNLGDVPNSYAYFKVRDGLNDVFLKKGGGLGRTFRFISPTLRLDYILSDNRIGIRQFGRTDYPYSDHVPLIADFILPSGQ